MVLFPNAKINLGLHIIKKRPDGFHEIETIFLPVGICDILEIVSGGGKETSLTVSGIELGGNIQDNLVMKAWRLMHDLFDLPPVEVHLHKLIPTGAGLGGGSADAAFMLKGLNSMFRCSCSFQQLEELAAQIGSDCAFFIRNQPALGTGRGEILTPIQTELEKFSVLLVNPGIHIDSREAYSGVKPAKPVVRLSELIKQSPATWQKSVINDFEASVFARYPSIGELKNRLIETGAVYSSLTGSGSSVYGLFRKEILDAAETDFGKWFTYRGEIL
jgi:4-diphosphocytidyl-2-C-methyl-D-erythritol kinase